MWQVEEFLRTDVCVDAPESVVVGMLVRSCAEGAGDKVLVYRRGNRPPEVAQGEAQAIMAVTARHPVYRGHAIVLLTKRTLAFRRLQTGYYLHRTGPLAGWTDSQVFQAALPDLSRHAEEWGRGDPDNAVVVFYHDAEPVELLCMAKE